jgi:type I restriction enzyme S subunit
MVSEVLLSDVIEEISMGPFGSDITVSNYVSMGVPVLNGSNLESFKLNENSFNYVTEEKSRTFRKAIAKRGDIIVTHRGTLGQISYVPENSKYDRYVISQSQFRVRFSDKKIDPRYITYLFHSAYGKKKLLSFKNHVGVPALAQATTNFRNLKILIHEFKEQKKIADIICSIELKIELNNKINDNLERMAKTFYDYWFVQFDFPDANGKPYKSSGGKMAWNEDLKKDIPEDWKPKELGEILVLEYGKPLKEEDRTGSGYPVLGSNGIVGYHDDYLIEGPGIVVGRKGTAGSIVWVEENFYPIDTTFYIKDKLGTKQLYFLYLMLLRTKIKQVESSSAVPGLNRNFVYSIKIAEPSITVIQNFNKILEPIFSKLKACNKENQQLSRLRDWLLPMLMNGQVKVK